LIRVGIDMDGTAVLYERLFHRLATTHFGLPADFPEEKSKIRAWLRHQREGEKKWVSLQGLAYGPRIREASEAPGLRNFLASCRSRGWEIHMVSHKGEASGCDKKFPLRKFAMEWLRGSGLLGPHGICEEDVHFASSREEKIDQIRRLRPLFFIDDLPEVLGSPLFPEHVARWQYVPRGPVYAGVNMAFRSWWDASGLLSRLVL